MKAKIGSIEVDGTPEEIAALIRELPMGMSIATQPHSSAVPERKFVSEEVAFKVLKRRPLSIEQSAALSLMRKNHPNWTLAFDLQKATNYAPNQLAGLLGALGKRVGSTEGYVKNTAFLDQEWDYEKDCYRYRLPEGVLAAVKRAGL